MLKKRDIFVIVLLSLALYVSLSGDGISFSLDPCWYLFDKQEVRLSNRPFLPPLVTDLDGDGTNELIMVSKDSRMSILSTQAPQNDYSTIFSPEVLESYKLPASGPEKSKVAAPVALASGYIVPSPALQVGPEREMPARSQVIVLMLDDWTIHCFDHKLKLLWTKKLAHKSHNIAQIMNDWEIDEAVITVMAIEVGEGSPGTIVIGASMKSKSNLLDDDAKQTNPHPETHIEHGMDYKEDGSKEHPGLSQQAGLEHFSMYALEASTGHVIWKHDGYDVKTEQFTAALPQHAFSVDVRDIMTYSHHASTTVSWRSFQDSLATELPHLWTNSLDTTMRLSRFRKHHVGGQRLKSHAENSIISERHRIRNVKAHENGGYSHPPTSSARENNGLAKIRGKMRENGGSTSTFSGKHPSRLSYSATSRRFEGDVDRSSPNVIVTHTKRGIEVITLNSGSPVTSLALKPNKLYGDLDGDGVVDEVVVIQSAKEAQDFDHQHRHSGHVFEDHGAPGGQHCSVVVLSGLPAHSRLFSGTLCKQTPALNDPESIAKRVHGFGADDVPVFAAPPALFPMIDPVTRTLSTAKQLVVAINDGIVTSYDGKGHFKWQYTEGPGWNAEFDFSAVLPLDPDASRVDAIGTHLNVHSLILVVGQSQLHLLGRDGSNVARVELPKAPAGKTVIGDFDSDGVSDIIIVTEDAILGYRLEVKASGYGTFVALAILLVISLIVFVANVKEGTLNLSATATEVPKERVNALESGSSATPGLSVGIESAGKRTLSRRKKGPFLSVKRSTESAHVD